MDWADRPNRAEGATVEFGTLTIDNPNAPARGSVAGDYAPVAVTPFGEADCQLEIDGGRSVRAAVAGIRLTAQGRRRIFGLPVGPRPRLGFPNLKCLLSFRDPDSGTDLFDDVLRGIWREPGGKLVDPAMLEVGGSVELILGLQLDGEDSVRGPYSGPGLRGLDLGRRGSVEVQIKLLAAGLPQHLAYLLDNSDGALRIAEKRAASQDFVAATRRVTPGFNRPG